MNCQETTKSSKTPSRRSWGVPLIAAVLGGGGLVGLWECFYQAPITEQGAVRESYLAEIEAAADRGDVQKANRVRLSLEKQEESWRAQRKLNKFLLPSFQRLDQESFPTVDKRALQQLLEQCEPLLTVTNADQLRRANAYLLLGEYETVISAADLVLSSDPENVHALDIRGLGYLRLRRYPEALGSFERASEFASSHDAASIAAGRAAALSGLHRYQEALRECDEALLASTEDARLHNNRAGALGGLGLFRQALKAADQAIHFRPNSYRAHNNRGTCLARLGRFGEALISLDKATKLDSEFPDAHIGRSAVLFSLGRDREALLACERALDLRPNWPAASINYAGILCKLGECKRALDEAEKVIANDPTISEAHIAKAIALNGLKRFSDALASCEEALRLRPDNPLAVGNKVIFLMHMRRYEDALVAADQSLERWPTSQEFLYNKAIVLERV